MTPNDGAPAWHNKVPDITLGFWIVKIMSTTVGETVADYLDMDLGLGSLITGVSMGGLLLVALTAQMRSQRFTSWIYWLTVVLVSVVGTQITDALTDGLDVSLYASTAAFSVALAMVFALWHRQEGTLSIQAINTPRREAYYWVAILCTFALGTAAGDLATESLGLGFQLGAIVFGGLIALIALAARRGAPAVLAFWAAYILTRPLGASLGDWLAQSASEGGLGLGAMDTSAVFLVCIAALVLREQQRARATE